MLNWFGEGAEESEVFYEKEEEESPLGRHLD